MRKEKRPLTLDEILAPQWPETLSAYSPVRVMCDDKGRNGGSWLGVMIDGQGDAWVTMQDWEEMPHEKPSAFPCIRIRTLGGGGRNLRTRQALLYLAAAIKADNEEQGRNQFGLFDEAKEQA